MERYSYQKVLGSGNFGKAWLVRSRLSNRPYVIKEVNVACVGEREREQAVNEVAILARLRHVNIVRYREAFVAGAGGVLAIVMEYADGGDLAQKIDRTKSSNEKISSAGVLNWFVQLTFALQYMHSEKILHRDLKPSNLFLTSKGLLKVGDFGIAKMLQNTLDHASTAIGTPYYLSPEICRRQPYNQKSDMWAAGCILYELVTLNRPFGGPDFSTLILRILHGVYTPIPSSYGDVLEDLITSLLSADPGLRPSAQDVLASQSMRPYVKSYTEQREAAVAPPPSPAVTPRTRSHKSPKVRPKIGASSLYTKSPYSWRQSARSRGPAGSFPSHKASAVSREESQNTLAKNSDSPWVKDTGRTAWADRQVWTAKAEVCHRHSASEPVQMGRERPTTRIIPASHRASVSSAQRKTRQSYMVSPVLPQGRVDDINSQGRAKRYQKLPVKTTLVFSSHGNGKANNQGKLSAGVVRTKRRRSCIAISEARTDKAPSPTQREDGSSARLESPKKRRRSLPERVKESKFLSRLVSGAGGDGRPMVGKSRSNTAVSATKRSKIGERLKGQTLPCASPRAPPVGLSSVHLRMRSEPHVHGKSGLGRQSKRSAEKQVTSVHKSLPPSRRATRPRKGSNAPITCLFPKAPEKTSKPRSRIKHGTYTLNLPTVSDKSERLGTATCQRCGCKCKPASTSDSKAVGRTQEEDLNGYRQPSESSREELNGCQQPSEGRNTDVNGYQNSGESSGCNHHGLKETTKLSPVSSPSRTGEVTTDYSPSPCGIFERGNAIRRPVRHPQRRRVRQKTEDEKDSCSPARFVTGDPKPDVIPATDDVFIVADNIATGSTFRANDLGDFRDDEELYHQMEVAGLLHAGMANPGELTTELRGKLELLKEYLEQHIGQERTLVAYDILSNAAKVGAPSVCFTGLGHSEDVVQLVAEVIGPGKMKYFPILVQAFNLSNQCE